MVLKYADKRRRAHVLRTTKSTGGDRRSGIVAEPMLAAIGQYVGGRVVTAILVIASAGAVIWFWKHPEQLEHIWRILKYALAWLGFVLILPWGTFFVTPWVVSRDSNLAAGLMLAGYLLADVLVAWWLVGTFHGHNALTWVVMLLGFLAAGVYNFKVCEFQADRAEGC